MSTTLTNGLKLPDKGSVDWYADMQNNYTILDGAVGTVAEHTSQIAGKAPAVHTHTKSDITDFPAFGNSAGTICEGNDSRLSDARTPVAHIHTKSDITDLLNSNFIPSANNSYDLGSSSYQWNNVYSKGYYYNGVAWGLDKYNQWTGVNDFNDLIGLNNAELWFKHPNIEDITTNPSADTSKSILQIWNKATTQYCGGIIDGLMTDGTHKLTISCLGFPLNNYGGYYPHSFSFEAKRDGTASFSPNYTNASLGTSTNQWKSVYAQSYYYNGTAWGLDQINVWTNRNILESWGFTIRENSIADSTAPSSDVGRALIEVWGGDFKYWGGYGYRWCANGNSELLISLSNWNGNTQGYWEYAIGVNKALNSLYFKPPNGLSDLGTSDNKWKTFNGVNPGALSLPDLASDGYIELSDNISANTEYAYTPAVDGWLALYVQTTGFHAENAVAIFNGSGSGNAYRWASSATSGINLARLNKYHGAVILPVRAGTPYLCWIKIDSSTTLTAKMLYFYKAAGNV